MHLKKYSFLVQDFRTRKKAEQMDLEKKSCKEKLECNNNTASLSVP
jgi:hypothetical protein